MVDVELDFRGNLGLFLHGFSNLVKDWALKALLSCWPEEWVHLDERLQELNHLRVTVSELFLVINDVSVACLQGSHVLRSVICGDKGYVLICVLTSLLNNDSHLVLVTYHVVLVSLFSLFSERRKWETGVSLEKY